MPAVIPEHVAVRSRLRETVKDVLSYNDRLEAVIAVKSAQPSGVFHGKIDHSSPPWNAAAADAILDLHAWSREAEAIMRLTLSLPSRERGNSSENTQKALQAVMRLAEGCDDAVVRDKIRFLDSWSRKASQVLGETEAAKRLPRMTGEREMGCPWCRQDTLRQLALAGTVFCIDPGCKDEEGRRPKAKLEYFQGDFVLRWQDGVMS